MAEFRFEKNKSQIETIISKAQRFIKIVAFQFTDSNLATGDYFCSSGNK